MNMVTPAEDLATHIGNQVGSLTFGTNLFDGPMRPPDSYVPVKAVFVLATGGPPAKAFLGETKAWKELSVSIYVRSDVDAFEVGRDLAELVWAAVHYASIAGYFDVLTRDPYPIHAGQDTEGRHIHIINADLIIKE